MSKIVLEDFNEGNGYYKVNLAYLSKEQVEEIEALVSKWNPTDEDIKNCIGMCLTDVNEQRFKDYGTNLKDCLAWLEKQGKQDMIPLDKVIKFLDEQLVNDKDEVTGEPFINFQNYGAFKETFISYFKRKMLEKQGEKFIPEDINEAALQYVDTCAVDGEITHDNVTEPYWNNHSMMSAYKAGWLEKQGDRKTVDKVEPKFKVGDWCIDNEDDIIFQIVKVLDNTYTYRTNEGKEYSCTHYSLENDVRLWTIVDAKDGDVLYSLDSKRPFIYKDRLQFSQARGYCCINKFGEFAVWYTSKCVICTDKYIPATKEQRDLLFAKMKEAGYEFDFDKKVLKKMKQKQKWSYEDEANLNNIIWLCNNCLNGEETTWIPSQAEKIKHLIETIKERGLT